MDFPWVQHFSGRILFSRAVGFLHNQGGVAGACKKQRLGIYFFKLPGVDLPPV